MWDVVDLRRPCGPSSFLAQDAIQFGPQYPWKMAPWEENNIGSVSLAV